MRVPTHFRYSHIRDSLGVVPLGSVGKEVTDRAGGDGPRASLIEIRGVVCKRGRTVALNDVSAEIGPGELVLLTGPSGAGKTTLLGIIHGDLKVSGGEARVAGQNLHKRRRVDLPRLRREVGMIYQDYRLLPRLTALENVVFAVRATDLRLHPEEAVRRARGRLEAVGMIDKLASYPGQLSGGEQQRLALARALATRPRVLLADEPTKNLDAKNVAQVISLLTTIAKSGTTVIVATHDQAMIRRRSDQQINLEMGRLVSNTPVAVAQADEEESDGLAPEILSRPNGVCSQCREPLPTVSIVEAGSRPDGERWCPGCRAWVIPVAATAAEARGSKWATR